MLSSIAPVEFTGTNVLQQVSSLLCTGVSGAWPAAVASKLFGFDEDSESDVTMISCAAHVLPDSQ